MTARGVDATLCGVGFIYSGCTPSVLSDVGVRLAPASTLWITGPNASGKSTLLNVLAGVIPEVIEGTLTGQIAIESAGTAAPVNAMVMQDSGVYLFRTVYDEVAFALLNSGIDPDEVSEAVFAALASTGVEGMEGRLMHTLSGGERQKVAVAAALAVDPDLLLLDEPFEQLDPASCADVLAIAARRVQNGTTLVVATRQAGNVPAGASRLHLVGGRPAAPGDTGDTSAFVRRLPDLGDVMLELVEVTHRYSATAGIERVSVRVHAGESVALLGPNGAGKTTLMKHTNGLLAPDSGDVRVMGVGIAGRPVWEIARDVGMLFQNPDDQIFNRTVLKEAAWGLKTRSVSSHEAESAAMSALEELGIAHLAAENPHEITASQRQLVAFASILVMSPRILVLDEPTKALDEQAAELVATAVDRRLADGAGALIVTHDLQLAARMADRGVVLVDGAVIWEGAINELAAVPQIVSKARLT